MLIIQLILCEMDICDDNWLDEPCYPITRGQYKDIYRSGATTLKQDAATNLFFNCPAFETMSIDFFFKYFDKNL